MKVVFLITSLSNSHLDNIVNAFSMENEKKLQVEDAENFEEENPEETNIIACGFLEKRGSGKGILGKKNWKYRYFELADSTLYYYENQNASQQLGSLDLHYSDIGIL
jgi:hypothetical protein